jgi:hypothetical protein
VIVGYIYEVKRRNQVPPLRPPPLAQLLGGSSTGYCLPYFR